MSMGTLWDETVPYTSAANSEIAMEQSPDRLRYALDRPIVEPPGRTWTYNGGAAALIGAVVAEGVGQPIEDFAREVLFKPLDIERFEWIRSWDGVAAAASGLRLTARDLAKIGNMMLAGGRWNGRAIVSPDWIDRATTSRFAANPDNGYGYFWWTGTSTLSSGGAPLPWYAGFGNGGQRLLVLPAARIVLSTFFGNYDQPEFWLPPARLWADVILPALSD
jgi:CubicO group peptidase (beta-lactamase class C family)